MAGAGSSRGGAIGRTTQVVFVSLLVGVPVGALLTAARLTPFAETRDVLWPLAADGVLEGTALALLGLVLWLALVRRTVDLPFARWVVTTLAFAPAFLRLAYEVNRDALPEFLAPLSLAANAALVLGYLLSTSLLARGLGRWHAGSWVAGSTWALPAGLLLIVPLATHWRGHRPAPDPAPDVLVLLIDVLGADRLGCYGYERPTSPNIDALAEDGILFENAISSSTFTKTSVSTLFTGLYPHHHLVYKGDLSDTQERITSDVLGASNRTLAERMHDHGVTPVAWVQNGQLRDYMGFAQGFSLYVDQPGSIRNIRPLFREWADDWAERTRYFAYLHFIDLHAPYTPPADLRGRFGPETEASREIDFATWRTYRNEVNANRREITEEDLSALEARHDETLLFVDDWVGGILDDLKAAGRYDDTLIVLLADHGDAFWEHGFLAHSKPPYEELVHVPLIVKLPGNAQAGRREPQMVGLVDVAPTLLDFVGAPVPEDVDGRSFLPLLLDPEAELGRRALFLEIDDTVGVRTERWKYIRFPGGRERLYDLAADPGEERDVFGEHPDVAGELSTAAEFARQERERGGQAEQVVVDPETVEALKALGYL